eukprot:6531167-Pyramimonas_sp.AAC.2
MALSGHKRLLVDALRESINLLISMSIGCGNDRRRLCGGGGRGRFVGVAAALLHFFLCEAGALTCGMCARAHICGFMVSSPTRMKVDSSEMFDIIVANWREEIFARSFRLYLRAPRPPLTARTG